MVDSCSDYNLFVKVCVISATPNFIENRPAVLVCKSGRLFNDWLRGIFRKKNIKARNRAHFGFTIIFYYFNLKQILTKHK